MDPGPILLDPILKAKVWGGARLAALGKTIPERERIGESWELADLDSTSPGGGGGGAARTRARDGAHPAAGRTVRELIQDWGPSLMGQRREHAFPLLVKYLDAREHLSVQVHPSPEYAATHPGAHLKTECWYVVEAEPDARIFKGVKPGVTRAEFEHALRTGQGEGVVGLLGSCPARAGDMHELPSGTVHALGAGVLVAEVQTPSDTTFRVYDWAREYGRTGRELHANAALRCIDFTPAPPATRLPDGDTQAPLVQTEHYHVFEHRLAPGHTLELKIADAPTVLMLIRGSASLGTHRLAAGDTTLVPASWGGPLEADEACTALRVTLG